MPSSSSIVSPGLIISERRAYSTPAECDSTQIVGLGEDVARNDEHVILLVTKTGNTPDSDLNIDTKSYASMIHPSTSEVQMYPLLNQTPKVLETSTPAEERLSGDSPIPSQSSSIVHLRLEEWDDWALKLGDHHQRIYSYESQTCASGDSAFSDKLNSPSITPNASSNEMAFDLTNDHDCLEDVASSPPSSSPPLFSSPLPSSQPTEVSDCVSASQSSQSSFDIIPEIDGYTNKEDQDENFADAILESLLNSNVQQVQNGTGTSSISQVVNIPISPESFSFGSINQLQELPLSYMLGMKDTHLYEGTEFDKENVNEDIGISDTPKKLEKDASPLVADHNKSTRAAMIDDQNDLELSSVSDLALPFNLSSPCSQSTGTQNVIDIKEREAPADNKRIDSAGDGSSALQVSTTFLSNAIPRSAVEQKLRLSNSMDNEESEYAARVQIPECQSSVLCSGGAEVFSNNKPLPLVPNPKRATAALHRSQYKKLAAPFRSPLLKHPDTVVADLNVKPAFIKSASEKTRSCHEPGEVSKDWVSNEVIAKNNFQIPHDLKQKHRTSRAAVQFKSPLSVKTSQGSLSSAKLTPTIQALERKIQTLKRAIKVKHEDEEDELEILAQKWKEIGREVAWEVWALVKDNVNSDDSGSWKAQDGTSKRGLEDKWGWEEHGNEKKFKVEERERLWGWDVVPQTSCHGGDADNQDKDGKNHIGCTASDEEAQEVPRGTLGTMLMQLNIAPETLGWNEEEATFQDD